MTAIPHRARDAVTGLVPTTDAHSTLAQDAIANRRRDKQAPA